MLVICEQCGKRFNKSPYRARQVTHHFCSRSCYADYQRLNRNYSTMGSYSNLQQKLKFFSIVRNDFLSTSLTKDEYLRRMKKCKKSD